ncbi:MAG: hypothetical protein JO108_16115 [Acidobacteriaceae bacterium]|nr:hypothetical protein [Acidobacteriaceae bacterium]
MMNRLFRFSYGPVFASFVIGLSSLHAQQSCAGLKNLQPGAKQYAFAPQSPHVLNSQLLRAGLIGPVQVIDESPSTQEASAIVNATMPVHANGQSGQWTQPPMNRK